MAAYTSLDSIPISGDSTVKRTMRVQRAQFGDGYSQTMTDGLNAQIESWTLKTGPLTELQASGIEAYFWRTKGQAFSWTPPNSTKTFEAQFIGGTLDLGWNRLDSLSLDGYARPTDYTANLATGVLTSVTIADGLDVTVELTLSPRTFMLESGWERISAGRDIWILSFNVREVYI